MMKFGVCTAVDNLKVVEETGYDYIELGLSGIAQLNEADFAEVRKVVRSSSVKAEAFNVFLPGTIKIVGEYVDRASIMTYVSAAVERAGQLGGRIIVFGSGGARNVPEGFSKEKAIEQLCDFLYLAGNAAREYDIVIAIEPLRPQECNIINTVEEAWNLALMVNEPNVGVLADYYHMACQNEGMEGIRKAGSRGMKHIHIANPDGRIFPKVSDKADYFEFFDLLKNIGYNDRISIEGKTENLKQDLLDATILWNMIK